ncbi:hypothetical protein M9Y10_020290 [Tritrichomonas musculus]|uniref:RING-type domain-containing protein n=1 Tax=Tritrichomonas musculus TaxID=1915356 RepID=A0ABR2HHU3_9EUKA
MSSAFDNLEIDSLASLSSLVYSNSNHEEEEEEFEEEEDAGISSKPPSHLHCHPDEELPPVAVCMCEKLFHPECNKCSKCLKQCIRGKAFINKIDDSHNLNILCMNCAEEIDKNRIICQVCLEEIQKEEISNKKDRKNTATELRKRFWVHKECLHCQICGLSERKAYQCIKNRDKTKNYIICLDCASIMNGGGTLKTMDPFVGRFIDDILPSDFCKQCQNCHQKLTCNGFVFANQRILCVNCGRSLIQEKKIKKI